MLLAVVLRNISIHGPLITKLWMSEVLTILPSVGLDLTFFNFKSKANPAVIPFQAHSSSIRRQGWMDAASVGSAILIVLASADLSVVPIRRHGYGWRVVWALLKEVEQLLPSWDPHPTESRSRTSTRGGVLRTNYAMMFLDGSTLKCWLQ